MKYFTDFTKIKYEGPDSTNPLAFKFYNPDEIIDGKPMKDHLRFSVAFWHTFAYGGVDMFGDAAFDRPWNKFADPLDRAYARIDAMLEFAEILGLEFFCFHDRDITPEGKTLRESNALLDKAVAYMKKSIAGTNLKLLWGTANLFSNPRYAQGASTSPDANVFAYAAGQAKKAIEVTKELDGQGYVFWGGREGYETLLNTDMKLELDNLATFLSMAADYARKIGFKGQFYIEPKPKEPTKHQYDFDAAACLSFLKTYGLDDSFKFNIEANHATLAGHTFAHELRFARINDKLGSIDANQGDMLLGWDTDQFPTNVYDTTLAMYEVIKAGGFKTGGLNFDAKVRRPSHTLKDLLIGHIVGMDTFAFGFRIAHKLAQDQVFEKMIAERYATYSSEIGQKIRNRQTTFEELESYVIDKEVGMPASGRQEELEGLLNSYIYKTLRG